MHLGWPAPLRGADSVQAYSRSYCCLMTNWTSWAEWSLARRHTSCMWHRKAWLKHDCMRNGCLQPWLNCAFKTNQQQMQTHLMPPTQRVSWPWMFFLPSGCCEYVKAKCCHMPAVSTSSPDSAWASRPAFISSFGSMQILNSHMKRHFSNTALKTATFCGLCKETASSRKIPTNNLSMSTSPSQYFPLLFWIRCYLHFQFSV